MVAEYLVVVAFRYARALQHIIERRAFELCRLFGLLCAIVVLRRSCAEAAGYQKRKKRKKRMLKFHCR